MGELIGFSREEASQDIELVSDNIREEIRIRVHTIFGNAKNDITLFYDKRKRDGKLEETFLQYEVLGLEAITAQMIETLGSMENTGLFIESIHTDQDGRTIRLYIKISTFWAKIMCTKDHAKHYDHRVSHHFKPAWDRELEY